MDALSFLSIPAGTVLSSATKIAFVLRTVTAPIVRNVGERLSPQRRAQVLEIANSIDPSLKNCFASMISDEHRAKLESAESFFQLGLSELQHGCKEWDKEWNTYDRAQLSSLLRDFDGLSSQSPAASILTSKCISNAMRRFESAAERAMDIMHGPNDRTSPPSMRVEALTMVLRCQIALHYDNPSAWFEKWRIVLERFLQDCNLARKLLSDDNVLTQLRSPDNKIARQRLIQIVRTLYDMVIYLVDEQPTLKTLACRFLEFIHANKYVKQFQTHKEWKDLLVSTESLHNSFWSANTYCSIARTNLSNDEMFVFVSGIRQITCARQGGILYAVEKQGGQLCSLDVTSPTDQCSLVVVSNHLVSISSDEQHKCRIFGSAEERGLLYLSHDSTRFQALHIDSKTTMDDPDQVPEWTQLDDYTIIVASNGSRLAYKKSSGIRYVWFRSDGSITDNFVSYGANCVISRGSTIASSSTEAFDRAFGSPTCVLPPDATDKCDRAMVNSNDRLLVVGDDVDQRLIRMALRTEDGISKIQIETIQYKKRCSYTTLITTPQLFDGCLVLANASTRIPLKGRVKIIVYLLGFDERMRMNDQLRMARVAKLSLKFANGYAKSMKTIYTDKIYGTKLSLSNATFDSGTLFCGEDDN